MSNLTTIQARMRHPAMIVPGAMQALQALGIPEKKAGVPDEKIFTVAAWRDAPYFSDAEGAALALTEAVTRISDREDPVPDQVWKEVARHYDERALAANAHRHCGHQRVESAQCGSRQVAGAWIAERPHSESH